MEGTRFYRKTMLDTNMFESRETFDGTCEEPVWPTYLLGCIF